MGGCGEAGAEGEEEGRWRGGGLPLCFEDGSFDCSGEHTGGVLILCSAVLVWCALSSLWCLFLDLGGIFDARLRLD